MDLQLKGLTAVVTGGTSGIGYAIAERFAVEGCNVITCSRSDARISAAINGLSVYKVAIKVDKVDVNTPEAIEWAKGLKNVDIFVPNVSALSPDWRSSIDTDLLSTVQLTEAFTLALASSDRAAITYVGSKASTFATPGFEAYGATKAAVSHYMKSLSQRLAGKVRVNTVSPGDTFVSGGFWDVIRSNSPDLYSATELSNPMKRFGKPEEIANAVVFLSSPLASFINGANLIVDGGATVHVHG